MKITFQQHNSSAYPPRTYENASADATIAFAFDFNTPGERLTYDAVRAQSKLYYPVEAGIESTIQRETSTAETMTMSGVRTLNIAGNGLYTCVKYGDYTQAKIDESVYIFLSRLFNNRLFDAKITLIRSGGQSGFDEAGIKAAVRLGIPALCLCPKGWKYRDGNGITICDEQKFKERFSAYM